MKKEVQVALLPTEDKSLFAKCIKSNVYAEKIGDLVITGKDTTLHKSNDIWEYQHLYILSDEEIRENDWFINTFIDNEIWQHNGEVEPGKGCKKVIATTDKKLLVDFQGYEKYTGREYSAKVYLSQIPQSFIEEYCDKGGIDKAFVEYKEHIHPDLGKVDETLIINSDNTINISSIKDSWSREEVKKLCKKAFIAGGISGSARGLDFETSDDWIKKNL